MKDEMCNFYMMYWYDPKEGRGSVDNSCEMLFEDKLEYPTDSDVPLPGSGPKMEMKRTLEDGTFTCLFSLSSWRDLPREYCRNKALAGEIPSAIQENVCLFVWLIKNKHVSQFLDFCCTKTYSRTFCTSIDKERS